MFKVFLLSLFCFFNVLADESDHPLSPIKGEGVELVSQGHSFAGLINGHWVMGEVTGAGHSLGKLFLYNGKSMESFEFKKSGSTFAGTLLNMPVEFVSLDAAQATYVVMFNQKEYKIRVESEDFKNNHFINPTYILELEQGKTVEVKLMNGQACYMYSLQLIMMIFGTYLL